MAFEQCAPGLMSAGTLYVMLLETLGGMLFICPVGVAQCRIALLLLFGSFQLGNLALMSLGKFPILCLICLLPYLPTCFWNYAPAVMVLCPSASFQEAASSQVASTVLGGIALYLSWYMGMYNVGNFSAIYGVAMVDGGWAANTFRLDQTWEMFSPVWRNDGWVSLLGRAGDQRVDLLQFSMAADVGIWPDAQHPLPLLVGNTSTVFDKPVCVSCLWKSALWQKWYQLITDQAIQRPGLQPSDDVERFLRYICLKWDRMRQAHKWAELEHVELWRAHEFTESYWGEKADPLRIIPLTGFSCTSNRLVKVLSW